MAATAPTPESLAMLEKIRELTEENKQLWTIIERLQVDFADHGRRLKAIEAQPRPNLSTKAKHDKKMRQVDLLLMQHNNEFMTFADIGKLLGYPSNTRRQNMTHLKNVFKRFPDRYEVDVSKLGGKKVRLVKEYLNHLLKGGP